MKKFLAGLLAGIILATSGAAIAAQTIKVFVNGQELMSEVPAQVINGRTMLPVRAISEALGAKITWDAATKSVHIMTDGSGSTPPTTGNSVTAPTNVTVTITKVEHPAGTEFEQPKAGNKYLAVYVTIKNNSKVKVNYNPLNFGLKDSKGNITSKEFATIDKDTALSYGELAPGGEVSGSLLFQVKTGDSNLYLIYEYDWQGKDVSIKIPS